MAYQLTDAQKQEAYRQWGYERATITDQLYKQLAHQENHIPQENGPEQTLALKKYRAFAGILGSFTLSELSPITVSNQAKELLAIEEKAEVRQLYQDFIDLVTQKTRTIGWIIPMRRYHTFHLPEGIEG